MKYFIGLLLILALPSFILASSQSAIIINEILPSPTGADAEEEWIEIFNQGDAITDLSGWKIEDVAGKIKTYVFPKGTVVAPQGFLLLRRPTTKITLNNEGDGLKLSQLDGTIVDAVNYDKASEGESYGLVESGWIWNKAITPGGPNARPLVETKPRPAAAEEQIIIAATSAWPILAAVSLAIFSGATILMLKRKNS